MNHDRSGPFINAGLKTWESFLLPKELTVFSDHQALKHFRGQQEIDPMLARWARTIELCYSS